MPEDERLARARTALISKAKRALVDPVPFFELVVRDEATNRHVVVAPHQRVLFSFFLAHDKVVFILPVGTGKTATCAGLGLWMLARNPSMRALLAGATQQQAKKPLVFIRQTIEASHELRLVNPKLLPSRRAGEAWSDTAITVDRPLGIRDPSFAAYGIDSEAIQGSRIDFALVDDLLNEENTASEQQRLRTYDKFFGQVANRIEPKAESKLAILNTTWHPQDYVNRLAEHWPTLRMSVTGDIWVSNAREDWDCEDLTLISKTGSVEHCRLAANEPDPDRRVPLWPARYPPEEIEKQRMKYIHAPGMFNRFFLSDARDDSTALCKREFVDRCKRLARDEGIFGMVPEYRGDWFTFTGVDLAVTPDKKGGETCFFSFGVRPDDNVCVILDIESGHWDALTIINKLLGKLQLFGSYAAIENNATQEFLIQVARSMGRDLPIRSHNTTAQGKAHPWQGVVGVFFEFATGKWRIPNDKSGHCPPEVQKFVDACLYYSPERHTNDVLMACYVARSLAMKLGALSNQPTVRALPGRAPMTAERKAMMR